MGTESATRWERRVLSRIRRGDHRAFDELFDQFAASVYGFAHRITADRMVAETITRSVFLDVWRHPQRIAVRRSESGLRARLTELARTAALEWRRAHPASARDSDSTAAAGPATPVADAVPEPRVPEHPEADRLARTRAWALERLAGLSAAHRGLVESVLFEGRPLGETAVARDVGTAAAAVRLREVLLLLSTQLPAGSRR